MPTENDLKQHRELMKQALNEASVQLTTANKNIDKMGSFELAQLKGHISAFFDVNGSCAGSASLKAKLNKAAFFDVNGSCGGIATKVGENQ